MYMYIHTHTHSHISIYRVNPLTAVQGFGEVVEGGSFSPENREGEDSTQRPG